MIEIALRPDASADPASVVTGAVLRRGAVEVVALNHLGPERPGAAALLVGLLSTTRQGSIRLDPARGDDPAASPVVDFGALSAHDGHFLDRGVAHAQQLLEGRSFGAIIAGFEVGRRFGGYAHASSSCRMGVVVDDGGAVVGYDGLFVCDASVFPEVPAAGTYLPTVLLAERLAALWLASG